MTYDEILKELTAMIPAEQYHNVLAQKECELDGHFLGFIDIYKHLSEIIPKNYVVIDFGCYLAAQCFFFKDHRAYIGVDTIGDLIRFEAENTSHSCCGITRFIMDFRLYKPNECFAICSYVPDDKAVKFVRKNFTNLFCFYPTIKETKILKREGLK